MSRDQSSRGGKPPERNKKQPAKAPVRPKPAQKTALANATQASYAYAWARYQRWAIETGNTTEPPVPMTVIGDYLLNLDPEISVQAVATLVSGISHIHRASALHWPKRSPVLDAVRRRIREKYQRADIARHLAACPDGFTGIRDQAIVLLRLGVGLSPEQMAQINRDDVVPSKHHLDLRLRGYHGNPDEILRLTCLPDDPLCPASALVHWLKTARIRSGAVFPNILSSDQLGRGLSRSALRQIINATAKRASHRKPRKRS